MNNFSDIGFNIETHEQLSQLYENTAGEGFSIKCGKGTYIRFRDASGAELYWQLNSRNEVIGMNPHFKGKSKRTVCLTQTVDRSDSELDGAFYAWANPKIADYPESGKFLILFDLPDYQTLGKINFPKNFDIQLTAFATEEFNIFESEKAFFNSQSKDLRMAVPSFIPSGLFSADCIELETPGSFGLLSGYIKEWELKLNSKSNNKFYWLLLDTLGGEIDIVADPKLLTKEPQKGNILHGQFWLSGQLLNPPV
jgi:hypothetical protein